ncbi:uncharacterized protein Tco025E_06282 [Trypanosoma conorhini]|uniref:Pentatricopeptide repeat-containing protein n=1 Tax=Trypanosoma conorhini TaxID=83891 RepID=A0A422P672_9TRYP|nr:uncharacterized protein Tco025E_06282 [Trypanosoma conorhini]RNF13217.1 hypothetical protein Tco025E_06282 [Trypanosoma conorhini]
MRAVFGKRPRLASIRCRAGVARRSPCIVGCLTYSTEACIAAHTRREQVKLTCRSLHSALGSLLEDRQCLYREAVLTSKLSPHRHALQKLLRRNPTPDVGAVVEAELTREKLLECMEGWVGGGNDGESSLLDFYNAILLSSVVKSDADVRLVLDVMRDHDQLEPNVDTYIAIMLSLIAGRGESSRPAADAAFYYFGHALKSRGESFITDKLWGTLFIACAVMEAAGKIVDQWWDLLVKTCEVASAPLPYTAVHAALTWCSANRDVERVMRFFHTANSKGVVVVPANGELPCAIDRGGLTEPSEDKLVQMCQLKLLVKLMVTVKSIKMDGGLRELVIKDIRRLIGADLLRTAPWGVINDLLSGLSMPSAMQLLKFRSMDLPERDGAIPFALWASLLRRCARDHHIDQAEAVFLFIRKRFQLTSEEKAELVEIMMRMFATLPQGDFASAMALFLEHVLRHPNGEPSVRPNATMYNLLIRAGDSRNAAMMTFLEACAAGVGTNDETFETVMGCHRHTALASLTRKLPHDYHASKLDEQLHIPANVDAHLRREEAMKLRGKQLVDSTGEVN